MQTLRSRMFVCCEQYRHARSYCWQWSHFTMGPNEQNQHFAELRQIICVYIHVVVLITCWQSLDRKLQRFVTKSGKSDCQTRVRQTIDSTLQCNTIQHNKRQYNTMQYNTRQHNAIQYNTRQCNTIQHNTIQYKTI